MWSFSTRRCIIHSQYKLKLVMMQQKGDFMAKNLSLKAVENLKTLRTINPQLLSYNVEMTEVTGGTFWKAYTPEQIAGTEGFPLISFGKSD